MNSPGKPEERVIVEVGERVLEAMLAVKIPGLRLRVKAEAPEIRVSLGVARANLLLGGIDPRGRLVLVPKGAAGFLARFLGGAVGKGSTVALEGGRILVSLLPPGFPIRLEPLEARALEGRIRLVSILST